MQMVDLLSVLPSIDGAQFCLEVGPQLCSPVCGQQHVDSGGVCSRAGGVGTGAGSAASHGGALCLAVPIWSPSWLFVNIFAPDALASLIAWNFSLVTLTIVLQTA